MAVTATALIVAGFVPSTSAKVALIAIGGALPTITATFGPVILSEVAPAHDRSRDVVTIASLLTLAGIISPMITGALVGTGGVAGWPIPPRPAPSAGTWSIRRSSGACYIRW